MDAKSLKLAFQIGLNKKNLLEQPQVLIDLDHQDKSHSLKEAIYSLSLPR
jgi:hypothetical protein